MRTAALLRGFLLDLLYLPGALLLLPWVAFLVIGRRRGVGALLERCGGWKISRPTRERIWIHCVSVGELQAVGPLLDELAAARPGAEFVLSVTTTTARDIARRNHPDHPVFLYPIDFSICVWRVLNRVRPSAIVLVELEVWPQMVLAAHSRSIPLVIVNGRISDRSFGRMRRLRRLTTPIFRRLTQIHARDEVCAERFRALGARENRVLIHGNLKLDRAPLSDPGAVRREFDRRFGYAAAAPRWVAGCTHPGEETILLDAHRKLLKRFPDLSLLLAPRHVERTEAVVSLVRERGFSVARESEEGVQGGTDAPPEVVVVDRIGVLADLYAVGEVAFVGGSLIERGGHNILEPVLASVATCHGPHMANFRELARWLDEEGVTVEIGGGEWVDSIAALLEDEEARRVRVGRGLALLAAARGSARRSASSIAQILEAGARRKREGELRSASVESPLSSR